MNYEITCNTQFGSKEIYFDGKPSEEIRNALKALKFRWHGIKKCWYGFADESTLISAILGTNDNETEDPATVTTDGYMGGGAIYGSKSRLGLYGQELKKAIAQDIKKAGIKGVTLSMKNSSLTATVKVSSEDFVSLEEYIKLYEIQYNQYWIEYIDDEGIRTSIHTEKYFNLDSYEEREKIRVSAAELDYKKRTEERLYLNEYYLEKNKQFTPSAMEKIQKINSIITAYHFDESNAMVDYFHTNFYYTLVTVPTKEKETEKIENSLDPDVYCQTMAELMYN